MNMFSTPSDFKPENQRLRIQIEKWSTKNRKIIIYTGEDINVAKKEAKLYQQRNKEPGVSYRVSWN